MHLLSPSVGKIMTHKLWVIYIILEHTKSVDVPENMLGHIFYQFKAPPESTTKPQRLTETKHILSQILNDKNVSKINFKVIYK